MADGLKDARKLVDVIRKVADGLGLEIAKFDLVIHPDESAEILFVARPEAIETNTERAKRKEREEFEALMGGQDLTDVDVQGEPEEVTRRREKRIEGHKDSAHRLKELLEGEDDDG